MTRGFCWVDLETTGLDTNTDDVLEMACILTDFALNELSNFHSYVGYSDGPIDEFVVNMHIENGLWDDLRNYKFRDDQDPERLTNPLPTSFEVDVLFNEWIGNCKSVWNLDHVEFAGSAIGQFDIQFIRRQFPLFTAQMHHRVFDCRTLKTLAEMTNMDIPDTPVLPKHRARSDAQSELKYARQFLFPLFDTQAYAEHVAKTMEG